jgi:hypothetical protein
MDMPGLDATPGDPFRLLVAVTFHFRTSRLQLLYQVIRALVEYPVDALEVVLITNVGAQSPEVQHLKDLCSPLFEALPERSGSRLELSVESVVGLPDPWLLPWCHKNLIRDRFLDLTGGYSHFIYIEDDILVSYDNFRYFVHYRDVLREHQLIPSFQRIEYNDADNSLYVVDQLATNEFSTRNRVTAGSYDFVNLDNPYAAMFVLDHELASEYVRSASFDRSQSEQVNPEWGVAERAAMGLCYENVPPGFTSRFVSPVDSVKLTTPRWSWVYHMTNNYSKNRMTPFAKVRADRLFVGDSSNNWRPPSKLARYSGRVRQRLTSALGDR